jgi:hypothetical protein
MPYQQAPPNFCLKDNLEAAITNVLQAVSATHPDVSSREQLSELLKYEKTTLYGRYNKQIDRWLEARGKVAITSSRETV